MSMIRVALANLRFPASPADSVALAAEAIAQAGAARADIVCFPECFVPGYRAPGKAIPTPDAAFLQQAWSTLATAAAKANVAVVLGTERLVEEALTATVLVIHRDGTFAGFQDKVQIAIEEEGLYIPGTGRHIFRTENLTFGIVICHEGWRYPETVRWAVRNGAQVVFHPHFHEAEPGSYIPTTFADAANTIFEKTMLCRAGENNCYFVSVNCASTGSPTTSAIIRPDGSVLSYQPYGREGLLVADLDLSAATGLLASRYKPV